MARNAITSSSRYCYKWTRNLKVRTHYAHAIPNMSSSKPAYSQSQEVENSNLESTSQRHHRSDVRAAITPSFPNDAPPSHSPPGSVILTQSSRGSALPTPVPNKFALRRLAFELLGAFSRGTPKTGAYLHLKWVTEAKWYGVRVISYISDTKNHVVVYDRSENHVVEDLDLSKRVWHYIGDPWAYHRGNNPTGPQSYVGRVILLDPNKSEFRDRTWVLLEYLYRYIQDSMAVRVYAT